MKEIVLTLVILGLVLLEIGLLLAMNALYFSFGIPLYRKRVSVGLTSSPPPVTEVLASRFSKSVFVPFLFRRFTSTRYGFREGLTLGGLFKVHYPPIMHGLLEFEPSSAQVVVTGYANIWVCAFFLSLARGLLNPHYPLGVIFFMVLVGSCIGIQLRRFARIASVAAEEWAEPTEAQVSDA